jgi:lysophospholipase L1-like esterase
LRRTLPVAIAITVAAATATAVIAAPASQASTSPLRYVAMGDSYSAASGNVPPDLTASPICLRSTVNYGHVIAAKLGAQLTDTTCGAADTSHFFSSQYPGVPRQLDAVNKDTQLITLTIGGNDSGVFINSILQCGVAGLSTAGQGSPCKDKYGDAAENTVRTTTYPSLVKTLKALRSQAPKAKIGILSYPWITPATGGCFPLMPIATGDVPYLRHLQTTLNDAVRRAAAASRVTYVDLNTLSNGHDACQPIGVRWVEPVLGGTNPVIVHPNQLGEAQMAAATIKALHLG